MINHFASFSPSIYITPLLYILSRNSVNKIEKKGVKNTINGNNTRRKRGERMKDYLGIESIHAIEVFDSRGIPTVEVEVVTEGGFSRKSNGTVWRINREF